MNFPAHTFLEIAELLDDFLAFIDLAVFTSRGVGIHSLL
jgi:hypothetical protein